MSDYHREKVLRIPFDDMNLNPDSFDDVSHDLWQMFGDIFYWNNPRVGKFDVAPTEEWFIDFILEEEYGADCGEWGKVRALTANEKNKYTEVFRKINPDVDMNKVHLVEFCWYNSSEAPNYYSMDRKKDPFYEEVPFICNFTLD
jgi:hypothetical protein